MFSLFFPSVASLPRSILPARRHPVDKPVFDRTLVTPGVEVGDYKYSARVADASGWLLCDGRSLLRSEFAALYAALGDAFGPSGGSTFSLPDCRGRVAGAVGAFAACEPARAFGERVGRETHTLTSPELPSHSHEGATQTAGAHGHAASSASAGAHSHGVTDPGHTHSQTTINDDFNSSGASPPGFAADSAGTRVWNNINSAVTGVSIDSAGAHTHAITVDSDGAHAHAFTTNAAGGGEPHPIMQPTLFIGHVFIYSGVLGAPGYSQTPE
jgi:microcystin-dependent protein